MKTRTLNQKLIAVVAVLLVAIFSLTGLAEALPNVHGYLITRDGKTMHFTKVTDKCKSFSFRYGPEGKSVATPLSKIAEVIFGEGSKTARIRLKDGRNIDAQCNYYDRNPDWSPESYDYLAYYYFDEVGLKERGPTSVTFRKISSIVIDDAVGRFRRCPHCKGLWPDSYLFCPHDGVRTVWGEAAGSLVVNVKPTQEQGRKRRSHVMEAILNASLARSGVDPASEEATKAKEFGKLWMNPLADPKEIDKKLEELRQDFLKKSGGR